MIPILLVEIFIAINLDKVELHLRLPSISDLTLETS